MSARFVSFGKSYGHGIRGEASEPTQFGRRVLIRPLFAQFSEDGRTAYDLDYGVKHLGTHGLPEDAIEGGEIDARSQMGVFDSAIAARANQWTTEDEEIVVETLRNSPQYGIDFVEVLHDPPFAGYEVMSAENILQAIDAGIVVDFDMAIAYERENLNREELIAELMARRDASQENAELPVTIDAS